MPPGDTQVKPLRLWLQEQGWPQRLETYDRYGGRDMIVVLKPRPTTEQLTQLREQFGDTFQFVDEVRAVHE